MRRQVRSPGLLRSSSKRIRMPGASARAGMEPTKEAIRCTGSGLVVQLSSVAPSFGGVAAEAEAGAAVSKRAVMMRTRRMRA
jgi:hypothetical protein